jgi:hypothetical protein
MNLFTTESNGSVITGVYINDYHGSVLVSAKTPCGIGPFDVMMVLELYSENPGLKTLVPFGVSGVKSVLDHIDVMREIFKEDHEAAYPDSIG